MQRQLGAIGVLSIGASLLGWSNVASAAPPSCDSLNNPVYLSGSTAIKTLIQEIAPVLAGANDTSKQLTVVYQGSGSCSGVETLVADTTPTGDCTSGGCLTGTANYWKSDTPPDSPLTCTIDSAKHVDLILSDVYAKSCPGLSGDDLKKLEDDALLVVPFGFIVPKASSQYAIDSREAYYAYGDGTAGKVTPWTNEKLLFQRNSGSGTQITVFSRIGVPITQAIGIDTGGTGNLITMVASSSDAEATLGFAGLDAVDQARDKVTTLAYRHWGKDKQGNDAHQKNYYWPDSSKDSYDKKNVRDGHYPVWGYEHAVMKVDDSGKPLSARGKALADYVSGTTALPDPSTKQVALMQTEVGTIPLCAMNVAITEDGGDVAKSSPDEPCGCYFEDNVPNGKSSCDTCSKDSDCSSDGNKCRNGFCEAH